MPGLCSAMRNVWRILEVLSGCTKSVATDSQSPTLAPSRLRKHRLVSTLYAYASLYNPGLCFLRAYTTLMRLQLARDNASVCTAWMLLSHRHTHAAIG
jgi:hypothetical protein